MLTGDAETYKSTAKNKAMPTLAANVIIPNIIAVCGALGFEWAI